MPNPDLRLYWPSDDDTPGQKRHNAALAQAETVTVSLGEILPLLADAVQRRRIWLTDFEDEEISVSADLYQVLLAYEHYRPSA